MAWASKNVRISHTEAQSLGLVHVKPSDNIYASPSRKSVVIDHGMGATGFTRAGDSWKVHLYDDQMAGHLRRRQPSEAIPYDKWLTDTRQGVFHDRR